jgi:hypothetical protein
MRMQNNGRLGVVGQVVAVVVVSGALACKDHDHTEICVGPGCSYYDGIGGSSSSAGTGAGGTSGAGGSQALDAGSPDAAVPDETDGGARPEPDPDSGGGGGPSAPCEIRFLLPVGVDAGNATLDGADDVDGEACGTEFTASVSLSSNGISLTLFVNDNPIEAQTVARPTTEFLAVLGNRGATGNTLRARATMLDGETCEATFGGQVFVNCPGPSCTIESPLTNSDGYLNASADDDDETPGLQTTLVVSSELEHAGRVVQLELDGDSETRLDSDLIADGSVAIAAFEALGFEDGTHSVQAECRDTFDRITLSPLTVWKVDTTPCTLEIDEIAGGSSPITPADDEDSDPDNGLQVALSGTITGNDCENLLVGICGGPAREIGLDLPENGDFSVHFTLANSTRTLEVCAHVEDAAGNLGPEQSEEVSVRTSAPAVFISSPADGTHINGSGVNGALRDDAPLSPSCEATIRVDCTDLGSPVELLVADQVVDTEDCEPLPAPFGGGRATFSASLPSQNDGTALVVSARQTATGFGPGEASPIELFADCEAPVCSLQNPNLALEVLNASLDTVAGPPGDLQNDFDVETDAAGDTHVALLVDGDEAASSDIGVGTASFPGISLAEGARRVQASCTDSAGNTRLSATERWTVDTVPCTSTLVVAGGADPITAAQDQDGSPGLQLAVTGQTLGGDCTGFNLLAGSCGTPSGNFAGLALGQSFSDVITLPHQTARHSLCLELQDQAGNVSSTEFERDVRAEVPVVSITSPSDGDFFNESTTCLTQLVATCSDAGSPVQLLVDGAIVASSDCAQNGTVSFPLSLASHDDPTTTTLAVRQTADGLTSPLDSISVQADCNAPVLSFFTPACSTELALSGDDISADPGLQIPVTVFNGGSSNVTLTVARGGNSSDSLASGNATSTSFSSVDLGQAGSVELSACATDIHGNTGCTESCALNIVAELAAVILEPSDGDTFDASTPDCDAGAFGLQVAVQGQSTAAEGSALSVKLGIGASANTTVTSGSFSVCVDAHEGDNQELRVTVTDSVSGLSAAAVIHVNVDTTVAGVIAAPTATVTGRRQGTLDLSWLSVLDSDANPLAAYRLRCAQSEIVTENDWDAATNIPVNLIPKFTAGQTETFGLTGFRTGTSRFCVVRGENGGGSLSPMTPGLSALVDNPFLTQRYSVVDDTTETAATIINVSLDPIGDINGDGLADFASGAANSGADVYLGTTSLTPFVTKAPDIQIRNTGAVVGALGFGAEVAGLGDITGDGLDDFAVTARGANLVFLFFGRDVPGGDTAWPASISLGAGACPADLCLNGAVVAPAASPQFGWDVHSANFDGTLPNDIVIAARNATVNGTLVAGRVFVLLGGPQLASGGTRAVPDDNPDGFIIEPPSARSLFGFSATSVRRSASRTDLVIGAVGNASLTTAGVFLVTGRAHVGTGLTTIALTGGDEIDTGPFANFATPVRATGDFDGDTLPDFVMGRSFTSGGTGSLYLGQSGGGFSSAATLAFPNDIPGFDDNFAQFTAQGFVSAFGTLGDLDKDGNAELLFGATSPDAQSSGTKGLGELFYGAVGSGGRARTTSDFSYTPINSQVVPNFVGDVNGDTYPDVAILDSGFGPNAVFLLY